MKTDQNNNYQLIEFVQQLIRNSRLNKHQHFHAAERNHFYNNLFGCVAILINVALGSVLFVTVSENLPNAAKWASGFMAMIAAASGGIQTFFNFQKAFEGHRRIANSYLEIQRECEKFLAMFEDKLITLEALAKEVELIAKSYNTVNSDAEVLPTGNKDFQEAKCYEKRVKEYEINRRRKTSGEMR